MLAVHSVCKIQTNHVSDVYDLISCEICNGECLLLPAASFAAPVCVCARGCSVPDAGRQLGRHAWRPARAAPWACAAFPGHVPALHGQRPAAAPALHCPGGAQVLLRLSFEVVDSKSIEIVPVLASLHVGRQAPACYQQMDHTQPCSMCGACRLSNATYDEIGIPGVVPQSSDTVPYWA